LNDAGAPSADAGLLLDAGSAVDGGFLSTDAGLDAGQWVFVPPVIDGTINAAEYGDHTDGINRTHNAGGGQSWFMTWDDTHLYLAVDAAAVNDAWVIYLDVDANASGLFSGFSYDGTLAQPLPFAADLVVYAKAGYYQYRVASAEDGGMLWGAQVESGLFSADDGTDKRELSVPWSILGGRPSSFALTGYLTPGAGFGYGQIPEGNPTGTFNTAAFPFFFDVPDATPGTGSPPFANPINTGADGG
jgi:hypothetical protein